MDNYKYNKYKNKYINYKNYKNQSGGAPPSIILFPDTILMIKDTNYNVDTYNDEVNTFRTNIRERNVAVNSFSQYIKKSVDFIKTQSDDSILHKLLFDISKCIIDYNTNWNNLNKLIRECDYQHSNSIINTQRAVVPHKSNIINYPIIEQLYLDRNEDFITAYMKKYTEYKDSISRIAK